MEEYGIYQYSNSDLCISIRQVNVNNNKIPSNKNMTMNLILLLAHHSCQRVIYREVLKIRLSHGGFTSTKSYKEVYKNALYFIQSMIISSP